MVDLPEPIGPINATCSPGAIRIEIPVNANSAEARRFTRFVAQGHSPGPIDIVSEPLNPKYPMTLDLRWKP